MPRLARKDLKTSFFHIIVQGMNREYIFERKEDIEKYLYLLKLNNETEKFKILAYCIMNNHAHILVHTVDISEMSKVMQKVNTSYARFYNREKKRVGYVFRDRYFTQPIFNEIQLFNCISYIHCNPVIANMVIEANQYKYSTYRDYIEKQGIVDNEVLKRTYGLGKDYLETFYMTHKNIDRIEDIKEIEMEYIDYEEIILEHKKRMKLKLPEIINNSILCRELILDLRHNAGLSLRDIGKIVNVGKDAVNKIIKN
jgi:REP element-mobilizing transposase RayT